jgi:hypothetical protein
MNNVAIDFFKTVDQNEIKLIKHELQFDFWQSVTETEVERLIRMTEEIKLSTNKVRKGLYAENGALKKRVTELESRLEILERHICHT